MHVGRGGDGTPNPQQGQGRKMHKKIKPVLRAQRDGHGLGPSLLDLSSSLICNCFKAR